MTEDRLRDSGGRVFLHCEQLATRKGYTKFKLDEPDFETVDAAPKPKRKKKKVAKKAAEPAKEAAPAEKSNEELEGWE